MELTGKGGACLQNHQKLRVICNVEAGCLGPDGGNHIEKFCTFAQKQLMALDLGFVHWDVVPRTDKRVPEVQYGVMGKMINSDQAGKFLALFNEEIGHFEGFIADQLSTLIDQYWGR